MVGEFFTEVYIAAIFFMILLLTLFKDRPGLVFIAISALVFLTLGMLFPRIAVYILNKFPFQLKRLKKLFEQFTIIRRSPWFYLAMLLTLLTAVLHGLTTYLLVVALVPIKISITLLMLVFYSSQFISLLLMAPEGLGVRDITMVGIFSTIGLPMDISLTIAILYRVIMFLSEILPGLFSIYILREI